MKIILSLDPINYKIKNIVGDNVILQKVNIYNIHKYISKSNYMLFRYIRYYNIFTDLIYVYVILLNIIFGKKFIFICHNKNEHEPWHFEKLWKLIIVNIAHYIYITDKYNKLRINNKKQNIVNLKLPNITIKPTNNKIIDEIKAWRNNKSIIVVGRNSKFKNYELIIEYAIKNKLNVFLFVTIWDLSKVDI